MLASGALGLISIPGEPRRLTREEIDARYPGLIDGLVTHPEIGFVLVRSAGGSSLVIGAGGQPRSGAPARSIGDDPLAPFGPDAVDQVREVDGYRTVADLMVNSRYDPDLDEVAAFEHQVGSHGALGGPQTHPFVLHPADLDRAGRADPRLARAAPRAQGLAGRPRPPRHDPRRDPTLARATVTRAS